MNLADIRNPHLIYPGQVLRLQRKDGRARLATADDGPPTVRLSPRVRSERLGDTAIPTLAPHLIEPFLSEPLVVDERDLQSAPRIVATQENHVLLSRGDLSHNAAKAGEHGLEPLLIEDEYEVSRALGVNGSPGLVLLDPEGRFIERPVMGAERVTQALAGLRSSDPAAPLAVHRGGG